MLFLLQVMLLCIPAAVVVVPGCRYGDGVLLVHDRCFCTCTCFCLGVVDEYT